MIAANGEWKIQKGYGYTEGSRVSLLTQDEVEVEFVNIASILYQATEWVSYLTPGAMAILNDIADGGQTEFNSVVVFIDDVEYVLTSQTMIVPDPEGELAINTLATEDWSITDARGTLAIAEGLASFNPSFEGTHTVSMYASSKVTHPISPELIPTDPEESNGYFYADNELTELVQGGEKAIMPDGTTSYRYETPGMYEVKETIMPLTHVRFERDENGEKVCTLFDYDNGIFLVDPTLGGLIDILDVTSLLNLTIGGESYLLTSNEYTFNEGAIAMHITNSDPTVYPPIYTSDIEVLCVNERIVLRTSLDVEDETTVSLSIDIPTELFTGKTLTSVDDNGTFELLEILSESEMLDLIGSISVYLDRGIVITIDGVETTMYFSPDNAVIGCYEDESGNTFDPFMGGTLSIPGKQTGDTVTVSMRLSDDPVILADNNAITVEFVQSAGGSTADIADVWNSNLFGFGGMLPNIYLQNLLIDIDGERFYAKNNGFINGEFVPVWMAFRINDDNQIVPALVFGDLSSAGVPVEGIVQMIDSTGSITPGEHTVTVSIAEQVNYLTDDEVEISFTYYSDIGINHAYIDDVVDKDALYNLTGCLEVTFDGDKYYGIIDIDGESVLFSCRRFVAGIPVDADADFYVAYDGFVDEGWYVVDPDGMFAEGTHTLSIKSADFDFRMAPNLPAAVQFETEVQNPKVNIMEYLDLDMFTDAVTSGNYIMPHINGERMFFSNVLNEDTFPRLFESQDGSMWVEDVDESEIYLVSDGSVEEADVEIFTKPELESFGGGSGNGIGIHTGRQGDIYNLGVVEFTQADNGSLVASIDIDAWGNEFSNWTPNDWVEKFASSFNVNIWRIPAGTGQACSLSQTINMFTPDEPCWFSDTGIFAPDLIIVSPGEIEPGEYEVIIQIWDDFIPAEPLRNAYRHNDVYIETNEDNVIQWCVPTPFMIDKMLRAEFALTCQLNGRGLTLQYDNSGVFFHTVKIDEGILQYYRVDISSDYESGTVEIIPTVESYQLTPVTE